MRMRHERTNAARNRLVGLVAGGLVAIAGATPVAASTEPSGDILADSQAKMDMFFEGTDRALPTSSPAPEAGKNVWVISCGEAATGCAAPAAGFEEAAALIGWDTTVFNGELNPEKWNEGIRQAIAAQADAIALVVIDCVAVSEALREADEAGIPVIGMYSLDCNETDPAAEPLFDGQNTYDISLTEWLYQQGQARADWIITQTNGEAKTILLTHDQLAVVKLLIDGFEERFAECTTCEIVETYDYTLADLGTTLQGTVETLLQEHPDANSLVAPYDDAVILGVGPAVLASGRTDELFVTGGEGFAANIDNIRNNQGQDFATGYDSTWTGWIGVDTLNRIFAGQPQVDSGQGLRSVDIDHNMPTEGEGVYGPSDYKANYRLIWGVEG